MLILVARLSKTLCCTLPVAGTGNRELKFLTPYLVLRYLGWEYRLLGLSHRKLCLTSLINVDMQMMLGYVRFCRRMRDKRNTCLFRKLILVFTDTYTQKIFSFEIFDFYVRNFLVFGFLIYYKFLCLKSC